MAGRSPRTDLSPVLAPEGSGFGSALASALASGWAGVSAAGESAPQTSCRWTQRRRPIRTARMRFFTRESPPQFGIARRSARTAPGATNELLRGVVEAVELGKLKQFAGQKEPGRVPLLLTLISLWFRENVSEPVGFASVGPCLNIRI